MVVSHSEGKPKKTKKKHKKHKVKKRKAPYVQRKMPKVKKARYFRCSNYPYHHWNELDNNEMWITEDKGDKFRVH